ncbi:MAG: hypothetical protein QOE51_5041 [Actinoplanes sp.]|jgi:WXG100 family type VII secretion target|nr:hypothetical protein [Actinoplanes sp.]
MASFSIDFSGGDEFVQSLTGLTNQIQSSLTELEKNVEAQLADWDGSTKDAYRVHKDQWDRAARQMAAGLAAGGKTMAQIVDLHRSNEQQLTRQWNS